MSTQADGGDDDPTLTGDTRIVHRAHQRFLRCKNYYDTAYSRSLDDTKFAYQDDRNRYGWDDKIFADRTEKRKPCLTINIVEPHNRLVINEAMENKASVRIRATGSKATAEAAQGMQALVDRTESISNATVAYRTAITHQIDGGFGYLELETRFIGDKSFDQDVYIKAIEDPRAVYLEPEHMFDPENAGFGFVFSKVSRDTFNREHPKLKDKVGTSTLGQNLLWLGDKHVLVAMYYEREAKNDELIYFVLPDGSEFYGHRSQMEADSGKELVDMTIEKIDSGEIDGKYRDVITQAVNWYKIGGDCILKRGDKPKTRWIGDCIPIIPCYGIKTIIEGKMDCKGHTRAQISPQQMLNYNASGQVQFGALQSQTPYIGPVRAFETNEAEWGRANIENYAYLAYDDWAQEEGEEGRTVAKPERQEPPQIAPVFMQGMQDAERWAMMVTGQYQSQMGQEDQQAAASGKAINARQRQGNIATYHFAEHQYDMWRYLGKQLIGIYPKLYDTKRILHVEGEDLSKKIITIDPDAKEAFQQLKKATDTAEEITFNPLVGEYEVLSDPGPNYATQRQQTFDALSMVISQNQKLADIVGDLWAKNADFAGGQEMAERIQKWIKHTSPWLFDDDQNPQLAEMQAQIVEGQKLNAELMFKLADEKLKSKGYSEKRDIQAYDSQTKRMEAEIKALKDLLLSPAQREMMEHDLTLQSRDHIFNMIRESNQENIDKEDAEAEAGQ